jgi:hypothetical protein
MSTKAGRTGAALAVAFAAVLASCTSAPPTSLGQPPQSVFLTDAGAVKTYTHRGVLVPGKPFTASLGTSAPNVKARYGAGTLILTSTQTKWTLSYTSTTGEHLNGSGRPERCRAPRSKVAGSHSRVRAHGANGELITIDANDEALLDVNPSGLRGLATSELANSVLLTPGWVRRLLADPTKEHTLDSWSNTYRGGFDVHAKLHGSLARGFTLQLDTAIGGQHSSVATDLGGIRCDAPSVLETNTAATTFAPVLVTTGNKLLVDGVAEQDLVPIPALQGALAVVRVERDQKPVHVELIQVSTGRTIRTWDQQYETPTD